MASTAQTSLLRTRQPALSLTADALFQFLEQFIIRAEGLRQRSHYTDPSPKRLWV